MAVYKCKMCGGTLEVQPSESVAVCDSCGSRQTIPNLSDERRANLYDRANHFRRANDFDKALNIYEQILNEDNSDAEAHWSVVLCRYGIEYVEDPSTHKRVPTVNRAQFTSVFADEDYKEAIANADGYQREIYEQEAKAIDDIQKGILEISKREEPFDVFISFKETDSAGQRTPDAVLANDLYHQLTKEGFKVFFAPITLEDKLGTEYEPYIFAALNSSKVMVVLGTKPEHFNAVWVKNEWSRYLTLIKNGAEKTLVPAYKDMDPYDLPEEFSHLMAQDMSKLGFMQDLIRGIKKIVGPEKKETVKTETVNYVQNPTTGNIASLLGRGYMALEDGEWGKADEFFEQVLNQDFQNAQAYLGKLMADLHVSKKENLMSCDNPFDNNGNYQKAIRFGDDALVSELKGYIAYIKERNENARIVRIAKEQADKIEAERKAEAERIEAEHRAEEKKIADEKAIKDSINGIKIGIPIVIAIIVIVVILTKMIIPNMKYNRAIQLYSEDNIIKAYETFISLDGYKDSQKMATSIYDQYKTEKLKTAKVGDKVIFGSYEQDNNISNGREDIKWLVLAKEDNSILVISDKVIDSQPYNDEELEVTWENCTLRKWLNSTFIDNAFSAQELPYIISTTVSADKNPEYDTDPGNATTDKIFLLSITEAEKYFLSVEDRKCYPTAFAIEQVNYTTGYARDGDVTCESWLRSIGKFQGYASLITYKGDISCFGCYVDMNSIGVRPVMWIKLDF